MRKQWHRWALQIGFAAVLLALWFGAHTVAPLILPTPIQILGALGAQIADGSMIEAVENALSAIFTGYALAVVGGVLVGLPMGLNRRIEQFLDPYLNALYVTPFSAMVPAMIVWFGTGFRIRVVVVFFFSVFPIAINTLQGAKTAPVPLIQAARSFGASRLFIVRTVILPHEISYLVAGLRLGMGRAVRGLVVTEILVAVTGFGDILTRWGAAFKMEGVFSVVLVLMIMGIIFTGALRQVEKRVVHWRVSEA